MTTTTVPAPKGVSTSTLWQRLVKAEKSNKSLRRKTSVGGGSMMKLGNPFTVGELATYGIGAFIFGAAEGKGIMPKTVNLGRTAVDTRLLGSGVLIATEFIKPAKQLLDKWVPKKYRGAAILSLFLPWAYDAGRDTARRF